MGSVDESQWVQRCPKCLDTSLNNQCPVSFETLRCHHCGKQALPPDKGGKDIILYYHCQRCGTRYLIPKLEEVEWFE